MGKKIKKLIPKEIAPAAPFIAAYFGAPYLGKAMFGPGVLSSAQLATAKGITAALASKATGGDTKSALRSGFFAATPDLISGGLQKAATGTGDFAKFLNKTKTLKDGTQTMSLVDRAAAIANPETFGGQVKLIGAQGAIEGGIQMKELNEKALRDYEAQLREQGIMDSSERRNKIFGYFSRAGYDDSEINSMLDKYGYAYGGQVQSRPSKYTQVAGNDRYIQLLEQFMYEGYDYDTASDMAFEALKSGSYLDEDYDRDGKATGGRVALANGTDPFAKARSMRGRGIPMTESGRKVLTMGDLIKGAVPNEDDENYEDDDGFKIYPKGTYSDADLNLDAFQTGKLGKKEIEDLAKAIRKKDDDEINIKDFMSGLDSATKGIQMAFGRPIDMMPERTRFGLADGGIMNLGGREMDMRGGGFIPIGSRERADDVPARLSKNEFVMTADAVRSAGGGSINKGAKRMYDLMNRLEAKA